MTIIDPPIKSTSDFYKSNKSFSLKDEKHTIHDTKSIVSKTEEIVIIEEETRENEEDLYSLKNTISKRKKWFIHFIVTLQGFLGPLTSSIYVPAIVQVRQSLNASYTAINATISLYVFVMGFAPLLWGSLSERHGRRAIYIISTFLYLISTIGCALAYTVPVFITLRAIQAIGASAAQAVGAGTITDLFDVKERGNAMGLFLLGALIGPVLGPIAGGLINEFLNWRYIFWCLSALGGLTLLLILFYLPETSSLILKKRKEKENNDDVAASLRAETVPSESRWSSMLLPFKFLLQPTIIVATTPYSIAYGFMYFVIASLPHQLIIHYHFASYQVGLAYLANGVGNAIGAYASGYLSDRTLGNKALANNGTNMEYLESRLTPMWLGVVLLPVGTLIYGWSIQYEIHVALSLFGLFILGSGVGIVQTPANTYIVDVYQKYSASAMSTANLLRCISAGCTPLVAPALIETIGNGWSTTILAIISVMSGICIFFVQRYGKMWRQKNTQYA